jgi:hypothetical protein
MRQKQDRRSKPRAQPRDEPLKKHGDKLEVGRLGGGGEADTPRQTGGAGEPQATPLEPEKQGGIGGP